ncbi:hypothetical protein AcW1_002021 [Taiwanofungus camphoratus]|nr:hypothetical protein AcW1_002021 [Antrodia cinnamomea]KAI0945913.1 hypothetical protein AcV7_010027 [Antrodia cinnamomea]
MATTTAAPVTEGIIPFVYQDETFQTYYKLFGDLANRTHSPLIVLHGGPGLTHDCMLPLSDLASASIPVILYDQLGNGLSTHLKEKPPTFWTIDLLIDELWGGVLGAEFEVRKQPAGLRHLILSDSLASSSLWEQSNVQLLHTFSKEVQEGMTAGMKDPKKFLVAIKQFHATILKDWSIIDRLHLVRVPTFVINGRKDIAQDFVVKPFFDKIRKVEWVTFEGSGHTPFWEEREKYTRVVADFLNL